RRLDADLRGGVRRLSARAVVVGDGRLRRRPRPCAWRGATDGDGDAAPDHAGRTPRRGDRAALDGDQLLERDDAARLRRRRRDARRVGGVLADGRGGRLGQPRGAPGRRGGRGVTPPRRRQKRMPEGAGALVANGALGRATGCASPRATGAWGRSTTEVTGRGW